MTFILAATLGQLANPKWALAAGAGDTAGQLSLPFSGSASFGQGPHNWNSSTPNTTGIYCPPQNGFDDCHPWNSLDFTASDGVVRAAREGYAHVNDCAGYVGIVRIDHGDGWQTTYYHLSTVTVSEGQWVNRGDLLGLQGETFPCGGHGNAVHDHFSVWYFARGTTFSMSDSQAVDLGGRTPSARSSGAVQIGNDSIGDGAAEGAGCLTNVNTNQTVCPGGSVNNDGTIPCPPEEPGGAFPQSSGAANQSGYFNWYGYVPSYGWNTDNIHMFNPGSSTATGHVNLGNASIGYSVGLGSPQYGEGHYSFATGAGGGPVQIARQSGPTVLASQRVNYIYSFDEANQLASAGTVLYFPYYVDASNGVTHRYRRHWVVQRVQHLEFEGPVPE